MKYFLTGANGFVGSYLAKELLSRGHQVKALRRPSSDMSMVSGLDIEWVEGDLSDPQGLVGHLRGSEAIVHAAAMVSFSPSDSFELYQSNVLGTENMVNAALELKIEPFGFVSSVAALGRGESQNLDENSKWVDSSENSFYAQTKFKAELEVWRGAAEGLRVSIVNPSIVLGRGDFSRSSLKLLDYVRKGNRFYTQGFINYVDVRDVASALVGMMEQNLGSRRYVLNAGTTEYKVFFEQVAQRLGVKAPDKRLSPFMAEIGWRLAGWYAFFTGSKPLITKETARSSMHRFTYSAKKICSETGFEFRQLEQTLDWCCKP
jgi:nucleoside-diphosphate-sugar epimerase